MGALIHGVKQERPLINGVRYNALINGVKVWNPPPPPPPSEMVFSQFDTRGIFNRITRDGEKIIAPYLSEYSYDNRSTFHRGNLLCSICLENSIVYSSADGFNWDFQEDIAPLIDAVTASGGTPLAVTYLNGTGYVILADDGVAYTFANNVASGMTTSVYSINAVQDVFVADALMIFGGYYRIAYREVSSGAIGYKWTDNFITYIAFTGTIPTTLDIRFSLYDGGTGSLPGLFFIDKTNNQYYGFWNNALALIYTPQNFPSYITGVIQKMLFYGDYVYAVFDNCQVIRAIRTGALAWEVAHLGNLNKMNVGSFVQFQSHADRSINIFITNTYSGIPHITTDFEHWLSAPYFQVALNAYNTVGDNKGVLIYYAPGETRYYRSGEEKLCEIIMFGVDSGPALSSDELVIKEIIYGLGKWIAYILNVGIYISDDGMSWTFTGGAPGSDTYSALICSSTRLYAIKNNNQIVVSSDYGVSFSNLDFAFTGVANGFISSLANNIVYFSALDITEPSRYVLPDGGDGTVGVLSAVPALCSKVAYANPGGTSGIYLATSYLNNDVMNLEIDLFFSSDGINWTSVTQPFAADGDTNVCAISSNGTYFVGTGETYVFKGFHVMLAKSLDGVVWNHYDAIGETNFSSGSNAMSRVYLEPVKQLILSSPSTKPFVSYGTTKYKISTILGSSKQIVLENKMYGVAGYYTQNASYRVDWGDGTYDCYYYNTYALSASKIMHTYEIDGVYDIQIDRLDNFVDRGAGKPIEVLSVDIPAFLLEVDSLDAFCPLNATYVNPTGFLNNAFKDCVNLLMLPEVPSGFSSVPDGDFMNEAFSQCVSATYQRGAAGSQPFDVYTSLVIANGAYTNCVSLVTPTPYASIPAIWK